MESRSGIPPDCYNSSFGTRILVILRNSARILGALLEFLQIISGMQSRMVLEGNAIPSRWSQNDDCFAAPRPAVLPAPPGGWSGAQILGFLLNSGFSVKLCVFFCRIHGFSAEFIIFCTNHSLMLAVQSPSYGNGGIGCGYAVRTGFQKASWAGTTIFWISVDSGDLWHVDIFVLGAMVVYEPWFLTITRLQRRDPRLCKTKCWYALSSGLSTDCRKALYSVGSAAIWKRNPIVFLEVFLDISGTKIRRKSQIRSWIQAEIVGFCEACPPSYLRAKWSYEKKFTILDLQNFTLVSKIATRNCRYQLLRTC